MWFSVLLCLICPSLPISSPLSRCCRPQYRRNGFFLLISLYLGPLAFSFLLSAAAWQPFNLRMAMGLRRYRLILASVSASLVPPCLFVFCFLFFVFPSRFLLFSFSRCACRPGMAAGPRRMLGHDRGIVKDKSFEINILWQSLKKMPIDAMLYVIAGKDRQKHKRTARILG